MLHCFLDNPHNLSIDDDDGRRRRVPVAAGGFVDASGRAAAHRRGGRLPRDGPLQRAHATPSARADMNRVVYAVFTPALMLASLANTVTLKDVQAWYE